MCRAHKTFKTFELSRGVNKVLYRKWGLALKAGLKSPCSWCSWDSLCVKERHHRATVSLLKVDTVKLSDVYSSEVRINLAVLLP